MLGTPPETAATTTANPAAPAASRPLSRPTGALLVLAAVVLPLLRQTGARSWSTIWGEDGWVYFQQAHDHGLGVLVRGYAGYLQLPPRLLAIPTPYLPRSLLTGYLAVTAALVCAGLAWFVHWATEGWIESRPVRLALAALVVLAPVLGYENTANLTNTIWTFFAIAPWALVARSATRRGTAVRSGVAFAAATATPLTAIFVPLAVGVAVLRRRRPDRLVCGAFLAGLALQFAVVTHTRDTRPHTIVRHALALPEIVGVKVFGQFLLGDRGIQALWSQRTLLAALAPMVVVGLVLVLLPALSRRRQALVLAFVGLAVVCFVVPAWGRGTNLVALALGAHPLAGTGAPGQFSRIADRYGVAPVLLLASAMAIAVGAPRIGPRTRTTAARTAFVAWVVVVVLVGFPVTNPRSLGPTWVGAVHRAEQRCRTSSPDGVTRVAVPNPRQNPTVELPCDQLSP